MKTMAKTASRAAGILLAFTVVFTGILAFTYGVTRHEIQRNEDDARRKLVAETLPPHSFNNDLLHNQITLKVDSLLGTDTPSLAWQARLNGIPVATVLEATAPDGYSGKINLLIGVTADGNITGVRVVSHKETPGLGDYIELAKSNWIHQFDGKSLANPDDSGWKVKKDGGQFDYMAGATITPRAVIKAVHHALKYIALHHDQLFAAQAGIES